MTNAKKNYIAHTYIFRNGALRHSEKEFGTAVAAFNYLYKKIKRYAGTTDVTHTVESPNGKELYRNRLGYDVRFADSEIEKLYDEYEGITDTAEVEEDYLDDYAVSVEAQEVAVEGETENAKAAEVEETSDAAKFKVGGIYKNELGAIYEVVKRTAKQMYLKVFRPDKHYNDTRRVRIETGTGIGDEWALFDDCHLGANDEMTHADAINYCFKRCFEIFKESQNDLKRYITEKNFRYAECVKNMVIKYRQELLKMKKAA